MAEHLPECWMNEPCMAAVPIDGPHVTDGIPPFCTECGLPCICDRLRACEARVSTEYLTPAALAATGMDDPRYAKGYARGLDAARDAVVAAIAWPSNWDRAIGANAALAAIDALRDPAPTATAQDIAEDRAEHVERDERGQR